ncbi:transcription-repair coupling factor [Fusobacterium mortiferum]|uniref:Transcription-repair-coupling factor n=1 Tax=Fusobacterium mortiferum TaxID=850 RepID=A0ABS2G1B4_FUSMR|nr:transcription-repair coupling factor [Fusobacterium mortiferum]MBM6874800.1 transcription-repair coupling factor [Fusobacterium mortiferum]
MEEKMVEYRGKIPFLLKELKGNILYLCSSNKNIEDYYDVLEDIYGGKLLKLESSQIKEELEKDNYDLLEILKSGDKFIILTSLDAILRDYFLEGKRFRIEIGKNIDAKNLEEELERSGYTRNYMVEDRNQFSIRGDIFDIFPKNSEYPVRIEFSFGDEIERVTYFDIETQKSIEKKSSIDMYINSNNEERKTLFSLLGKLDNIHIFMENRELLEYKLGEILKDVGEAEVELRERFQELVNVAEQVEITKFEYDELHSFEDVEYIKKLGTDPRLKIKIVSEEEKRYREIFQGENFEFERYPLFEGYRDGDTLVLTDRELKGVRVKRERRDRGFQRYKNVSEIQEGDYIIHENYGVGIYLGVEIIDGHDYLKIKYADEDKLFVPIEGIGKIGKYISYSGEIPEIYKLGRKGFRKKREKITEELIQFAKEIVEIQAKRELEAGYIFAPDTLWQEEFEEGFPYRETTSQLKAIEDVKRDMESPRVMDRVVCGDVGFGKTEVAIRAAFKAAIEGKQVVVMVPTTVLAQQHYERFTERMKNYPITIELLSRLSSLKEQKTTLDNILSGAVDIVIGTHRILSEDVKFKDLGLVIIDEEQKFGVKAKEHLKRLRNKIDMLTLTATPIPRTLNLALLGIRDLSVIDTPPEGRKPIETIFLEGTDKNIRDAIMREIAREGQVFYIFNSVKGIEKKVYELKGILPEYLKIGFVHGKMLPKEIKERIKEFENGEIDVLLATTIIENGIDIENANTMIIDRADKLGLSQIYQLRGRVGRGNRQSYCYLLTKEYQSKKAKDREESIKMLEETGGGGLQLSMEDMRIRGAGEILGEKQHGALETFGYTLYMKMLQEEIEKIKGEFEEDLEDIEIKVNYPAFIPESYIEKSEKIKIYRRVADIKRESELQEIKDELIDRFGKMPIEAQGFFKYIALKFRARKLGVKRAIEIKGKNESDIKFHNDKMNFEKLLDLIQKEIIRYQKKEDIIEYDGTIEEFLNVYEQ